MNRRILLAAMFVGVASLSTSAYAQQRPAGVDLSRRSIVEDPTAPKRGQPAYDVTIVEFSDYNCPFCRRMEPVVASLIASDPKVRIVYRDWPIFGAASKEAAELAIASQWQGRHTAFHTALMRSAERLDSASIRRAADAAKVDWGRLQRDLVAHRGAITSLLSRTDAIARMIGFNGTPVLLVGRQVVPGAIDLATLRTLVSNARHDDGGAGHK